MFNGRKAMRPRHRAGGTPPQKQAGHPGSWSIALAGRGQKKPRAPHPARTLPRTLTYQGCSWLWDSRAQHLVLLVWCPWVKPAWPPLNPSPLPSSPQLLGKWVYITGGSTYPPHVEEMKVVKYAAFSFFPGSHEDELNVTESTRV